MFGYLGYAGVDSIIINRYLGVVLMRHLLRALAPLVAVWLLVGCESAPEPEVGLDRPAGIDWFEGSVEGAFATAKTQDKPIFLYWGAVWCPPCHEL